MKSRAKPRVHIYSPDFCYTPSGSTDLRKTFSRIRKEMAKAAAKPSNVEPITRKAKA